MTILELLNKATLRLREHQIENPRLNAEVLLIHTLKIDREELYLQFHQPVGEEAAERFDRFLQRRISGEPLQYIVGRQEFWSIDFKVDPRVLIPRPETELLVEQTLSLLPKTPLKGIPFILEIGTGCGAVAVALAKEIGEAFLVATDISLEALILAQENAKSAGVLDRIQFIKGDLFGPFRRLNGRRAFDFILSNPPYIARSQIETLAREVKNHEPIIALDGGEDGLTFYRRILSQAPHYLEQGGWLLLEVGEGEGLLVSEQMRRLDDFLRPTLIPDLSGKERVVVAQRRFGTERF